MCVDTKHKKQPDDIWLNIHAEYMNGGFLVKLEDKYQIPRNTLMYQFHRLNLPKREKKQKVKSENAILNEQGLKRCRSCQQIKTSDSFTNAYSYRKDGSKKRRPASNCKQCVSKKEIQKRDELRGKPKELPALEKGFKVCPVCNEEKTIDLFGITTNLKTGNKKVISHCYECRRIKSLTENLSAHRLEKKRETDRARARKEENREKRNAACRKYQQSEKGIEYYELYNKKKLQRWIEENAGLKSDLIHVECSNCGCKQVRRHIDNPSKAYLTRCDTCRKEKLGITFQIKEVECTKCGELHIAKTSNSTCSHCKRKAKRHYHAVNRHKIGHSYGHRKRSMIYGCKYEPINRLKVYDRDGWKCYLCGIDVVRVNYFVPNLATLDHVKPMSKGGSHTYDNVRCCCVMCNSYKGDKEMTATP
jgi:hypothetical protein